MIRENDIDFNLFKVFQAIYQTHSISKAALALGVSQPTVSKSLVKLRHIFGDPLFVYISKVMQPTERAHGIAQTVLNGVELLENTLQENRPFDPQSEERVFRIGMSDYSEDLLLPPLLHQLQENQSAVKIEIEHLAMARRHEALEKSVTDVNIHGSIAGVHHQKYSSGILQKFLFEDRYVFVLGAHHQLPEGKISLKKLAELPHARYGVSRIIDKLLSDYGLERNVVLQVPHIVVLPKIVTETDLIVTVPERLARSFAKILPLQILEVPVKLPTLKFHMYWHEKQQKSQAHIWLRQSLSQLCEEIR